MWLPWTRDVPECALCKNIKLKNFIYIPTAEPSDLAPHRSESQFSASYWAPFPTLFTVNGLSVALLMWSLVLCNQVLSELRRVHFTGSQGTRSNQNAVFPPVCNNTTITFHHCCAVIHFWRKVGTTEQTNKHTDREWNQRGITEPEADSFLPFFFPSTYVSFTEMDAISLCCYPRNVQCLSTRFSPTIVFQPICDISIEI